MKNLLIAGLVLAGLLGVFVACKNTPKATNTDRTAAYACPIHPEITGKAGDTCSKCGMDLVPVKADAHATYACPMHPEITGKVGDKCSKCGMDLVRAEKPADHGEEGHKH